MKNSVKVRKIIFEILFEIYKKNLNFEESYTNFTKNISISERDKSMIFNVSLNSMRNIYFINDILNKYLKKRTKTKIKILLLSAITQIFILNFKNYAVTNDTVEVAKIKKLNPNLINALLINLIGNIKFFDIKKINPTGIPNWFNYEIKKSNINASKILKNSQKEPSLHLVFKDKKLLKLFNEKIIKTTEKSAFIIERKKINNIKGYSKGDWWVQDFSSMLPIYLSSEFEYKKIIDLCSAPGGKAFQALSLSRNVFLNDSSKKRIKLLKDNLKRLNFNEKVNNFNALNISEKIKYDVVILDSPCSGIGTIRRNPEILFKKRPPDINSLSVMQKKLLNKAKKLLNPKGIILYMVCSFFYEETKAIKKNFLEKNQNFAQLKFKKNKESEIYKFIDKDGDINCIPSEFNGYMIDGFYAVKFIKNA